tara:strand:- start:199 stop:2541 length:2343 start_codon:yes stop_codon:yes gene_type:complete
MRILDLGEAGYEGQSEAQKHYFYIEGDYDQDRGITDYDCEEITKQLVGMGLQASCQPDETRQGVVQIDTFSGRTTVQDGLEKAGYEVDHVPSPFNVAVEQAISEAPNKFTKADFEENEAKNYHTENGVELAKAFGTPEEIEQMEEIAKNHYSRGHILSHEIDARNEIVGKYFPSLESQEEAIGKMSEGNLGPGDLELLKPMVDMKPEVLKMYAKNIIKKYPHLKDNVMRLLPTNEAVTTDGPEAILAKYPKEWEQLKQGADIMDFDKLYQELFSYYMDSGEMPYGVMKARDGDPYQWISDELDHLGLLEAKLTKGEEKEKEHIVKGMKKNKDDFKKRYGDEAEAVMYATATKLAKEDNANIFKKGANDAMTLAKNMTNMHSKIDSKLANSPFSKTSAFKNYKSTNQANKIAAMKQGVPYGRQDIGEDFMDDRKYQSLEELRDKLVDIESHIKRLGVMDGATEWEGKNPTGAGDIHDQLTGMYNNIKGLMGATERALKIVPAQDNPDTQEFNKKYGIKQEADSMGMNKYGLAAAKKDGKFISYRNGKKTGEFDSMEELSKHQLDLIKDESVEVNELDIKKNFQNIANKVGSALSNVVNQKSNKVQTKKSFGKDSLASKINWGGKYESEDINELDTFAPKTDYIKGPGGEYYKIEYRNNSGLTGQRKDDTARFVSVNPASDKEITALDLDSMIAKGDTSIHQGHDHQGGLPFSDRDIAVYAYGDDDYEEGVPNNAKMKLIKVMTTEAEKKKKSELGTKIRSWRETKADMKKKIEASKPGDKK